MLRALVAVLAAANLAFFAWTQGWLDEVIGIRASDGRDPGRLAQQVDRDRIRILPPGALASAALGTSCIEAGPFDQVTLVGVRAALHEFMPTLSWLELELMQPGVWGVVMGKFTREQLSKKEDELKRLRLPFEELREPPELAPGLALGRYDSRAAADTALADFNRRGLKSGRVEVLSPPQPAYLVRIERAEGPLTEYLAASRNAAFGNGFKPCSIAANRR